MNVTEFRNNLGAVTQQGYIVADIDSEIKRWSQEAGLGPWLIIRNVRLRCDYLGQPSEPLIDVALSYRGDLQIELIQQHNDAPSPYRGMIESSDYGLHHDAWLVRDIDLAILAAEQSGLELVCDIRAQDGARYAYLADANTTTSGYMELLQSTALMRGMIRHGQAASRRFSDKNRRAGRANIEVDLASAGALFSSIPKALMGFGRQILG